MARRAVSLFTALAVWAAMMSPAGAQVTAMCDGRVATIVGTSGNDVLEGTNGPDVFAALQGDDILWGFGGDDVMCGGVGDDLIVGGGGFDIIFGAQGDDEIYAAGEGTLFMPLALDDTRGARIFAGAGNDLVYGSDRWDRMQGGPGSDVLYGFAGNDWMRGGPDRDLVVGHAGRDDLHGGGGNDQVLGDRNDTSVRAGAGNDACPNLTGTSAWRGCTTRIPVDTNDPTLPGLTLPAALDGGIQDTYVYLGYNEANEAIFVGITRDLDSAFLDQRFVGIREVSVTPLTRGQALAVQQAVLEVEPGLINELNAISPFVAHFDDSVSWGRAWLQLNGWL